MASSQTDPVRVYQPIVYGPKPLWRDLTCSFIGGPLESPHRCAVCDDALVPLVQLHHSLRHATTQVWACNRVSCFRTLFPNDTPRNALHYGGNGIVVANQFHNVTASPSYHALTTVDPRNEWDITEDGDGKDDCNLPGDESNDLKDLEQQLASLETRSKASTKTQPPAECSEIAAGGFPGFALHSLPEPPVRSAPPSKKHSSSSSSDAKIQQMLQQYLQVEEDEGLRQMLLSQCGTDGKSNMRDEVEYPDETDAVTEDQAVLQLYIARLQRVPRQVIRCGGTAPLWSVPVRSVERFETSVETKSKQGAAATSLDTSVLYGLEQSIPPCAKCGAPLHLELQLLPSLLHALRVDDHAKTMGTNDSALPQGMDWGNIAIYTCFNNACINEQAFCVVQDSIDGHAYAQARARQFQPAVMEESSVTEAVPLESEMDHDGDDEMIEEEGEEEDDDECV